VALQTNVLKPETAPSVAPTWEAQAHRGDWLAFKVWLLGFGILASMALYDLIASLFRTNLGK
jgi:hypothetical protein